MKNMIMLRVAAQTEQETGLEVREMGDCRNGWQANRNYRDCSVVMCAEVDV